MKRPDYTRLRRERERILALSPEARYAARMSWWEGERNRARERSDHATLRDLEAHRPRPSDYGVKT